MYRILYVDEDQSDRREFKIYCKGEFEVVDIHPPATLDELLSIIDEVKPDALVTDYQLTENDETIEYNGDDLATLFLRLREDFPVFLLTSYEDSAIDENLDPSFIYSKDVMSEIEVDKVVKFKVRVNRKIEVHRSKIDKLEEELLDLKSRFKSLSEAEKAKLIKIDSEIERMLGSNYAIEEKVKDDIYMEGLNQLIEKADEILNRL